MALALSLSSKELCLDSNILLVIVIYGCFHCLELGIMKLEANFHTQETSLNRN